MCQPGAGRPRDIEDGKSILLKNAEYDTEYMDKWLKNFDQSLGQDYSDNLSAITNDLE
jgi:hypothetical protein